MQFRRFFIAVIMLLGCFVELFAQSLSGFIINEDNDPVPFVNVFVREFSTGTSSDPSGKYFINLIKGQYQVVISAVGYETKQLAINIGDKDMVKNIYLKTSSAVLDEVVLRAKKRDPGVDIIQKAIENRERYESFFDSYKTEVYVKATEIIDEKEREKRKKESENKVVVETAPGDIFDDQQADKSKKYNGINLMEVQMTLNYQAPDRYKEERSAYKVYGTSAGLFVPTFSSSDFNFYHNLVYMPEIMEVPVISPISRTAVLTYKLRLEESVKEGDITVHKISVTPRKSGSSAAEGFIYINDSIWNINRLDLSLNKGGLKIYDQFNIKLYYKPTDSTWIQQRLEFQYETKQGKYKDFRGNTVISYKDFQRNYQFPEKFFGSEVAVTTEEAYKRDSSYWTSTRPEPLTELEQELVHHKDSIQRVVESKEYQDSLQQKYNKVTFLELAVEGVGIVNNQKKSHWWFPSVIGLVGFEVIGGWRFSPSVGYNRRYENGRMFSTWGGMSYGLRNNDVQGNNNFWMRYDPYKLGDISVAVGRSFQSINSFDAYLNQLRAINYILHDRVGVTHTRELFNGFYLYNSVNIADRKSVRNYNTDSFINDLGVVSETEPLDFEDYRAVITETTIRYTPGQRYMTEPNRKIVLGSSYPTFSFTHRKGWNKTLGSDIDFDYLGFAIDQDVVVGIFGNSKYKAQVGKFINSRDLRVVDIKRFRQSDPILYSDPLNSFQILDDEITTSDFFFEVHHIHHFNGALVNNLPLIKKTGIRLVAGAGLMWLPSENFRYQEVFAGVERVFKLGARRRLRLGVYGVAAESSRSKADANFKISFDIIDTWKKDWSF
jgi:hypothetical protein